MNIIKELPFPTFIIDQSFNVLELSASAEKVFGDIQCFTDIMDEGSHAKKRRLLGDDLLNSIEITLKTEENSYELFAVSITWKDDKGFLQCYAIGSKLDKIMGVVQEHQNRLATVDFELLSQKELAETQLKQIKQLSAPVIGLSKKVALVPLFGYFDQELISNTEDRLAATLYEQDYTTVIFDFNGIDQITDIGISLFQAFMETLQIMGIQTYIVGVKPMHTHFLKNREVNTSTFLPTLQQAIALLT